MVQTPQQRRANAKFAKEQESKMGTLKTPKADRETRDKMRLSEKFGKTSPVSKNWVYLLLFILLGGIFFEILKLFF